MRISAAFATSLDTPDHIRIAEDLGYERAWLYDTPQQSPDVWMCLALAAQRTTTIGLGPGVLVPTLRHPMVNASAAAALEQLAPGRIAVAFGTGYTARRAMGQSKQIPWRHMTDYINTFRALLRGDTAEWDGARLRMLHQPGSLPSKFDEIPLYLSAIGPKGLKVAESLTENLMVVGGVPAGAENFSEVAVLIHGSVLRDWEPLDSKRLRITAGPALAQIFHVSYELGGPDAVRPLPGGPQWLAHIEEVPARERHLAIHAGHLVSMNVADTAAWDGGAHVLLEQVTTTGTADAVAQKVADLAAGGVTEILYQPIGDIRGELERFAAAVCRA
ncbi:methylene-tetrahydromethanopterin reductase [Rhodococcus opacus]|uniref:Methylene-tetrahydromethanopterin reductase n=1 Tax=Rhodococcus opacus TaxID=37919 RepID=A0A2S8IXM3_RHOOP|nr:methylene-tetrahydromethanopterin reductase [Rhodococcus opacus]